MKYHLLWVACTVGILQLSAVLCRSAHDKVTSTDNEKYPSTVAPSVAYTGQEFEHGTNSSNKLALDPGPMAYDGGYYYRDSYFDYPLLFICLAAVFIVLTFFGGCILMFLRAKKIRPGLILNHNLVQSASEGQRPGTSGSQEPGSRTQQLPVVFRTVPYAQQPQPVLNYRPLQQPQAMPRHQPVPQQNESHAVPSTSQTFHQALPLKTEIEPSVSVVEFINPVSSVEDLDEK